MLDLKSFESWVLIVNVNNEDVVIRDVIDVDWVGFRLVAHTCSEGREGERGFIMDRGDSYKLVPKEDYENQENLRQTFTDNFKNQHESTAIKYR